MTVVCPYCGDPAKRVRGRVLYPGQPNLIRRQFWRCTPCDATVGEHRDGRPLGSLANRELRGLRQQVHKELDRLWLRSSDRRTARSAVYQWMARSLDVQEFHVGWLRKSGCIRALAILRNRNATDNVAGMMATNGTTETHTEHDDRRHENGSREGQRREAQGREDPR